MAQLARLVHQVQQVLMVLAFKDRLAHPAKTVSLARMGFLDRLDRSVRRA
jgi:hypothetical protein